MHHRLISVLAFIVVLFSGNSSALGQQRLLIAAASDLKFAMDSLISVFQKNTADKIEVTYGSSGKLSQQIANGAPFHLFFSADISYPEQLRSKQPGTSQIYQYALGRIVIWSKTIDAKKEADAFLDSQVKKIAIANPAHAPYGKRAIEYLKYNGIYDEVASKLVYGENISQAAQFISTGAADIGIIALSLALSPQMKKEDGNYYLIPDSMHQPLQQGAVITSAGSRNSLAESFFDFTKSEQATAIFLYFGFNKP